MIVHVWRVAFDTHFETETENDGQIVFDSEEEARLLVTKEGSIDAIKAQLSLSYPTGTEFIIRHAEWIGTSSLPTQQDFAHKLFPSMMPEQN